MRCATLLKTQSLNTVVQGTQQHCDSALAATYITSMLWCSTPQHHTAMCSDNTLHRTALLDTLSTMQSLLLYAYAGRDAQHCYGSTPRCTNSASMLCSSARPLHRAATALFTAVLGLLSHCSTRLHYAAVTPQRITALPRSAALHSWATTRRHTML